MAAQGRDIKLSPQRVEGYRNFATKLWNAARFVEFNGAARVAGFDPRSAKETLNRWIAHETAKAAREITAAIEAYRFNEAADAAYRFVWNVYCDWYVELSKPVLTGPDGAAKDETRAMAAWALDEILKLLHPFMPFITEELWRVTGRAGAEARRSCWCCRALAARYDGLDDDEGRGRDRLGDRSRHRDPLGARRDEHHARRSRWCWPALRPRPRRAPERWTEFVKRLARVSEISFRRRAAGRLGAAPGARRGRGACRSRA